MSDVILNPECAAGKCSNCDGRGWDEEADEPVDCPHYCHHADRLLDWIQREAAEAEAHLSPLPESVQPLWFRVNHSKGVMPDAGDNLRPPLG